MAPMASRVAKAWTRTSGSSRSRGFTLLEVLLVCVLLALATGLTVSFLSDSDQKQFTVNLGQISAHLRNARRQAIITGTERQVTLATEVEEPETPDAPEPAPPDWFNENMQLQFAESLDDDPVEQTEITLMFFPMGSSTGGLIELSDSDREAWLYVDPLTGKLMIENRLDDLEERLEEGDL